MNPLAILPFLFLTPNEATLQSKYLSFNLNHQDIISSTGKIRAGTLDNNLFINRNGLLNATAGSNIKIKKFSTFYTITQSKTKIRNENKLAISELLTNDLSNDFGIYLNKIGYEQAVSKKSIEGKLILNYENQTSIEKFNESLTQISQMLNLGFSKAYIKLISNQTKCSENSTIDYKVISSVDFKYLNWVFDGKHKGYLNSNTKPVDFFIFNDGALILETNDYSDLEKYKFHKEIEDKNRLIPRIYDLKNETLLNYLENPFFSDKKIGFRLKIQKGKKPDFETKFNFKNIVAKTNFKKSHLFGLKYKGIFLGLDINEKELNLGFKK